jgi:acetyltransferase-like isoleucine patch superfamily enzyme
MGGGMAGAHRFAALRSGALRVRRRRVEIGAGARVGRGVRWDVARGARVVLEPAVTIGDGCRFHLAGGTLRIGARSALGARCVVAAHTDVDIGADCVLADAVALIGIAHRFADSERPVRAQGLQIAPIQIADGARIGPAAAVLGGARVAAGASVGAHAVVGPPPGR